MRFWQVIPYFFIQQFNCEHLILILIYCHILFVSFFSLSHHKLFDLLSWSLWLVRFGWCWCYCYISKKILSTDYTWKFIFVLSFIHTKINKYSRISLDVAYEPTEWKKMFEIVTHIQIGMKCRWYRCMLCVCVCSHLPKTKERKKLTRKRYFHSLLIK